MSFKNIPKYFINKHLTRKEKKKIIFRYIIFTEFKEMRKNGKAKKVIFIELSAKYKLSVRNIQRIVNK